MTQSSYASSTGNHFIEVCLDETQTVWVMLHSGSRGVGNAIGTHFIEQAKKDMERYFIHLPDKDLAYIPEGSPHFKDYVEAVAWAQDFAQANREVMMARTLQAQLHQPRTPLRQGCVGDAQRRGECAKGSAWDYSGQHGGEILHRARAG